MHKLAQCITATSLQRVGFGPTIRRAKSSVLASLSTDLSEDELDYFFHWLCDTAVVTESARLLAKQPENGQSLLSKGAAILSHVRAFVPPSGDLSEQCDQTTGGPTSARDLAWSCAPFLAAWVARKKTLAQVGASGNG